MFGKVSRKAVQNLVIILECLPLVDVISGSRGTEYRTLEPSRPLLVKLMVRYDQLAKTFPDFLVNFLKSVQCTSRKPEWMVSFRKV